MSNIWKIEIKFHILFFCVSPNHLIDHSKKEKMPRHSAASTCPLGKWGPNGVRIVKQSSYQGQQGDFPMLISKHHMGWTSATVTFAWAEYPGRHCIVSCIPFEPSSSCKPTKTSTKVAQKNTEFANGRDGFVMIFFILTSSVVCFGFFHVFAVVFCSDLLSL